MDTNDAIDLVYTWVDGSDPAWLARRNTLTNKEISADSATDGRGRYTDNDELRHSLRSVEMYAPWIRHVFIVTDRQIPAWLDTDNPKVSIVDHSEILPPEALPCFNSRVLEHHLHLIPGLSERFLFSNDDMMLNRPVEPGDFYAPDGLPYVRLKKIRLRKLTLKLRSMLGRKVNNHKLAIHNSALMVERRFGKYYGDRTHHNIDAYLRSDYQHARELFATEIDPTVANHFRAENDLQRNMYTYVALAEGRMHPVYVDRSVSYQFHIEHQGSYGKLERANPMFLCMNDSQKATDADRQRSREYLEHRFPTPSSFEKNQRNNIALTAL